MLNDAPFLAGHSTKYSFDKGIDYFIKGDGTNTYYLIDSDNISVVKLTEE